MSKTKKVSKRDFLLGFTTGILFAIILSSIFNAVIFKRIINENRAQRVLIQQMLEKN